MRARAASGGFRALLFVTLAALPARADEPPRAADDGLVVREALAVSRVGSGARSLVHTDAVEARIVAGTWSPPAEGDALAAPNGEQRRWTRVTAAADGVFSGPALEGPTYLAATVTLPEARTFLLHAVGNDFVYVNGELRPGDPYGHGWWRLPVRLRAGANELLFRVSRGRLTARLLVPPAPWYVQEEDRLVGDLDDIAATRRHGEWVPATVTVVNTLDEPVGPLHVGSAHSVMSYVGRERGRSVVWERARVPALSLAKVPLNVFCQNEVSPDDRVLPFTLRDHLHGEARGSLTVRTRGGTDVRRKTFVSAVDGSVQYAALRAAGDDPRGLAPTIVTLHGASVEAMGQAEAHAPKPWARFLAPTNRRPYGFDWEDWGRIDALEALDHFGTPGDRRMLLTGHSMGGHGTWHLGVTHPDLWAALGPSAGWVSFRSYGGAPGATLDPVVQMLDRAGLASETLGLLSNVRAKPVYALHGDADDNVPVEEMRTIVEHLRRLGGTVTAHEQPGAGHWWDVSPEPGADCVDWKPLMDLFREQAHAPADRFPAEVAFTTAHPGVSARCDWVRIETAERPFRPSRVRARADLERMHVDVTTENVERLTLDFGSLLPRPGATLDVDGRSFVLMAANRAQWPVTRLRRTTVGSKSTWDFAEASYPREKHAARCGPFKAAFDHGFQLVYGTAGTPEENAWALAKARYDAEAWTYRANGRTDVLSDVEYLAGHDRERNAILYGHRDMNRAWEVLGPTPIDVRRGVVEIGTRTWTGDGFACLCVLPRPGSEAASIGIVAGTGLPGLRLGERLPYFTSGVAIPDCVVLSTDMLLRGEPGVLAAGFFGNDWSLEQGTWTFR